jgi:2-keto-3-deoxy-L-rhamnonate aldolase RhmA
MGIPEERDNPAFVDAIQRIIDTAERHGVAGGAYFGDPAHTERLIRQGGRFIPYRSDVQYIKSGVTESIKWLRATAAKYDVKKV